MGGSLPATNAAAATSTISSIRVSHEKNENEEEYGKVSPTTADYDLRGNTHFNEGLSI